MLSWINNTRQPAVLCCTSPWDSVLSHIYWRLFVIYAQIVKLPVYCLGALMSFQTLKCIFKLKKTVLNCIWGKIWVKRYQIFKKFLWLVILCTFNSWIIMFIKRNVLLVMPVLQVLFVGVLGSPQLRLFTVRLYSVKWLRLDTVWLQQLLVSTIRLSTATWKPLNTPAGFIQDSLTSAIAVFGASHCMFVTGLASAASNRNECQETQHQQNCLFYTNVLFSGDSNDLSRLTSV